MTTFVMLTSALPAQRALVTHSHGDYVSVTFAHRLGYCRVVSTNQLWAALIAPPNLRWEVVALGSAERVSQSLSLWGLKLPAIWADVEDALALRHSQLCRAECAAYE